MGTWIAHLRVADLLLDGFQALDADAFVAGSVAPDAGKPLPDGAFDPPKVVTHWLEPGFWPQAAENFRRGYLEPRLKGEKPAAGELPSAGPADRKEASFLAGYYAHLVADSLWNKLWHDKRGPDVWKDAAFLQGLRLDGDVLDRMYLVVHPDSVFFSRFLHLDPEGYTLPWFPPGRIEDHLRTVARLYGEPRPIQHKHVFRQMTDQDMRDHIAEAAGQVERALALIGPLFPAGPARRRR